MARFILALALLAATASAFVPGAPTAIAQQRATDASKSPAGDSSTALAYGYNSYNNGRGFLEYNDYFGELCSLFSLYLSVFSPGRAVVSVRSGVRGAVSTRLYLFFSINLVTRVARCDWPRLIAGSYAAPFPKA